MMSRSSSRSTDVQTPRSHVSYAQQWRFRVPTEAPFLCAPPQQPEVAVGAVADGDEPEIVLNDELVAEFGIDTDFIAAQARRELASIKRRRAEYAPLRARVDPEGRAVIVIDDGVATGMTMQAALRHLKRRKPARLIAAVPVASREALEMLEREADEVVCLTAPRNFSSVGRFYRDFGQVSDEEVATRLRAANG